MKEVIASAARKLILEKKVKKLTVKDIVEECQITRQAFYYHFEGIPDLIQWSIGKGVDRLLEETRQQDGPEAALKYLFVFAINAMPDVRRGVESNYGKEVEQTLRRGTYELFEQIVEEENLYQNYGRQELKLLLRYHSSAILGLLQDWTPEEQRIWMGLCMKFIRSWWGELQPVQRILSKRLQKNICRHILAYLHDIFRNSSIALVKYRPFFQ